MLRSSQSYGCVNTRPGREHCKEMAFWLTFIFIALYFLIIVACICVVLSENRNPIRALSWTIALLALPGVGLIFYLFFGRSLKGMAMISRRNKRKLMHHTFRAGRAPRRIELSPQEAHLARLANNLAHAPLTAKNRIEIFTDGHSKFSSLLADLRMARKSILLQYYIFADDELGREVAGILMEKAKAGVQVCVIYDHVGSFSAPSGFFRKMREAGVKVHPFFRVTFPQLANRINWRNHRKIAIIDDRIGYVGGMNVARRYVEGLPDGSPWRDTHFRVEGEIVQSLYYSFAIDWNFLKDQPFHGYRFEPRGIECIENQTPMQFVTAGPTDRWSVITTVFLKAITNARQRIYIQTPYFLPTDALLQALQTAALAKIDVRIMMPRTSDSRLLKLAGYSYITQCLQAGIKVYLYEPGMLHAKSMVVDSGFTTAGSTNFDFRSFENNFEGNLLIYDTEVNRKMREIFFADMEHCTKLTLRSWTSRPRMQRMFESIVRLFSPLL